MCQGISSTSPPASICVYENIFPNFKIARQGQGVRFAVVYTKITAENPSQAKSTNYFLTCKTCLGHRRESYDVLPSPRLCRNCLACAFEYRVIPARRGVHDLDRPRRRGSHDVCGPRNVDAHRLIWLHGSPGMKATRNGLLSGGLVTAHVHNNGQGSPIQNPEKYANT